MVGRWSNKTMEWRVSQLIPEMRAVPEVFRRSYTIEHL